jgi:tetratricopeptide (TPR) repeat protein
VDSDDDIKTALENVFLYQIDGKKGDGKELAKEFKIRGYPSFVMTNSDGQTLDRWVGYEKDFFIETLNDALEDLSTIEQKLARFDSEPTVRDASVLGRYSNSLGEYKDAVMYYTVAQKMNNDPSRDYAHEIFENTARGMKGEHFTFEDVIRAADDVMDSEDVAPEATIETALSIARLAKENDRLDVIERYIEAGLEVASTGDDPEASRSYNQLMTSKSLYVTGDKEVAVKYKKATMPDGWLEDAGQLNAFCWWCFENLVNLKEAEKLSRKSVELAEPGSQKAMNLDTLAEICNALGNCREAAELIKMAMTEDPESEYYPKQLEKFEDNLESSDQSH